MKGIRMGVGVQVVVGVGCSPDWFRVADRLRVPVPVPVAEPVVPVRRVAARDRGRAHGASPGGGHSGTCCRHVADRGEAGFERARTALAELARAPELCASRACAAELARAQAEVACAAGDLVEAELKLRHGVACWLEASAPVHAAEVRLRLGELLLAAGDRTAAELELGAAEATFRQVQAEPMLQRCQALRAGRLQS